MMSKCCVRLLNINKYYRPAVFSRSFSEDEIPKKHPHPVRRTLRLLANDMRTIKNFIAPLFRNTAKTPSETDENNREQKPKISKFTSDIGNEDILFPAHCDILVVGGGAIGASTSYWLKKKAREGLNVVVLERDYPILDNKLHLSLPVGGLHQQFFLPENVQMSLYGAEFMMKAKNKIDIDVNFDPQGFLTLASEENAETLKNMSLMQNELGARTELLTPERLRLKFPWLNVEDVALGSHGIEKHGWYDATNFLIGLRHKAKEYGTHFVKGELIDFEFKDISDISTEGEGEPSNTYMTLDKAVVKMPDGDTKTITFAICVLATEKSTESVAHLAKIGTGKGILMIPLPIQCRNMYGYSFSMNEPDTTTAPGFATPCIVDFNGLHVRRDGLTGNYITGFSTPASRKNVKSKEDNFQNVILPSLMHRLKMRKAPKIVDSWESSYEYNVYDENGIIGLHSYYSNLFFATGFSGLGLQQSPAVGRAISELIIDGQFRTIDLTRLGFDRLVVDQPISEYAFM